MFHLLSHIDESPLPAQMLIGGTPYLIVRGGLLLEPAGPESDPFGQGEGQSIIKFFGHRGQGEESSFVGSSSEPYRWKAPGQIDVSRIHSDRGARFTGLVEGKRVQLLAQGGARFLAPGTQLTFVAAPDAPITSDWSQTFDYGAPQVAVEPASHGDDPLVRDEIRQFIARGEPERLQSVRARLEKAWHAPA